MRYVWRSRITQETVEVSRTISDRDVPPTADEIHNALDINPDNYIRIIEAPPGKSHGSNWTGSKGNW